MQLTQRQKENQEYGRLVYNKYLRVKGEYDLEYLTPEYFKKIFRLKTTSRISHVWSGIAPNLAKKINSHLDKLVEQKKKAS